jgi:hypothetical protein
MWIETIRALVNILINVRFSYDSGNSLTKEILASHKGLCSIKLVSQLTGQSVRCFDAMANFPSPNINLIVPQQVLDVRYTKAGRVFYVND